MSKRKQIKKKKSGFNKFATIIVIFIISLAITRVSLTAYLSKINYDVEIEKRQISEQRKTNESLTMAINELASLAKIEEVAQDEGLRYNNKNIKTIKDQN